jgi:hypothetical protein
VFPGPLENDSIEVGPRLVKSRAIVKWPTGERLKTTRKGGGGALRITSETDAPEQLCEIAAPEAASPKEGRGYITDYISERRTSPVDH